MTFTITAPLVSWLFIAVVAIEAVLLALVIKAVIEITNRQNRTEAQVIENFRVIERQLDGKAPTRKSRKKFDKQAEREAEEYRLTHSE